VRGAALLVDRIKDGIITATDDADPIDTGNQGIDAMFNSLWSRLVSTSLPSARRMGSHHGGHGRDCRSWRRHHNRNGKHLEFAPRPRASGLPRGGATEREPLCLYLGMLLPERQRPELFLDDFVPAGGGGPSVQYRRSARTFLATNVTRAR
jgi:hypothetical protein